ncbi:hypothetical protein Tco_0646470 [Tanacetum coccineum]
MKELGEAAYILGIKIYRDRSTRILMQEKTILSKAQGASTPAEVKHMQRVLMPISIANEPGITRGTNHYGTKVYYLREVIELGDIRLVKVYTDDNVADPFTKALPFIKHSSPTKSIGLLLASSLM